jgi:hypothetical protein
LRREISWPNIAKRSGIEFVYGFVDGFYKAISESLVPSRGVVNVLATRDKEKIGLKEKLFSA